MARIYLLQSQAKVQLLLGNGHIEEISLKALELDQFQETFGILMVYLRNADNPAKGLL